MALCVVVIRDLEDGSVDVRMELEPGISDGGERPPLSPAQSLALRLMQLATAAKEAANGERPEQDPD